jgi:hypothetical protein
MRRFSLMTLFGIVTLAAIGFGVYRYYERQRIETQREKFASNLRNVVMACHLYSIRSDKLPLVQGCSHPGWTWRETVGVHLTSGSVVWDYDHTAAWDSPINARFRSVIMPFYCCLGECDKDSNTFTYVVAVTGPGTAFESKKQAPINGIDGDTILFIELKDSNIHWLEPKDMHIDELRNSTGIAKTLSNFPGGFHVAFADRVVWFLDEDIPRELVATFCTIEGSRRLDRDEVLGPYRLK